MTHRLAGDSSWWSVLSVLSERKKVSIVLIGSAIYMTAEQWFGEAVRGMAISVLEAGYTVPAGCTKTDMDSFERSLREADRVISI